MKFKAERNRHGAWVVVFGTVVVIPCQADDSRDDRRLAVDVARLLSRDEQAAVLASELPAGARTWRLVALGIVDQKYAGAGVTPSTMVAVANALYRKAKVALEQARTLA